MPESRASGGRTRRPAEPVSPNGDAGKGTRGLVCNVAFCPICMAVTAAQGAAPDAVEHLLKAAGEFFLAARAVIDVRGDHLAGRSDAGPATLERIDIA